MMMISVFLSQFDLADYFSVFQLLVFSLLVSAFHIRNILPP